jgi:hypothetical protein
LNIDDTNKQKLMHGQSWGMSFSDGEDPNAHAIEYGSLSYSGASHQCTAPRASTSAGSLSERSASIGYGIAEALQKRSQRKCPNNREINEALEGGPTQRVASSFGGVIVLSRLLKLLDRAARRANSYLTAALHIRASGYHGRGRAGLGHSGLAKIVWRK